MVIVANIDGTVVSVEPSTITQGSNLVQTISLITPALSRYTAVDISFILPNGQTVLGGVMTPSIAVEVGGAQINSFSYKITKSVSNFPGTVQVGFKCYDTELNEILATYNSQFNVVATTYPGLPEVEDTDWQQTLSAIAYITGKIDAVPQAIEDAVEEHNLSPEAHADIRTLIANIENGTTIVPKAEGDENGVNINTYYQKKNDDGLETASTNVVEAINGLNSGKQDKIDNSLNTTNKTVVGAINEVKATADTAVDDATTTTKGIVEYATDVEASAGVLEDKVINPKQLQANINSAITGAVIYKGEWVITGQTDYSFFESLLPIKAGWEWYCQGTTSTIDGIEYTQGDYARFNQNVAVGETITTAMIDKIDNTETVVSVDGQVGAVETNAVKYTAQTLTNEQKAQARVNIGAGSASVTDYNELTGKPILNADLTGLNVGEAVLEQIYCHTGTTTATFTKGDFYKVENGAWVLVSVSKDYMDTTFATSADLTAETTARENADSAIQEDITAIENNITNIETKYIGGNTNYGSTLVTNLNTITKDGFYTIRDTGSDVPNTNSDWFVIHQNSSTGTAYATQRAVAFDDEVVVFERTKTSSVWNAWQPANAPTEALVPQIRFNGTSTGNVISGTLDSSVATYTFKNQGLVNVYLVLPLTALTGVLNSNFVIRLYDKDNNLIVINNINHSSAITSANVGDMCQLQKYNVNAGYEWQFTARYSQFDNGGTTARVLYTTDVVRESVISLTGGELYSHIVNNTLRPNTYVLVSESYTNGTTTYTEGVKYKIEGTWTDGELFTDAIQESDPTREDISHKKSTPDIANPSATDYLSELGTSNFINDTSPYKLIHNFTVATPATSLDFDVSDGNANNGYIVEFIGMSQGATTIGVYLKLNDINSNYDSSTLQGDTSGAGQVTRTANYPDAKLSEIYGVSPNSNFRLDISPVQNNKIHYTSSFLYTQRPNSTQDIVGIINGICLSTISKLNKITIWCGSSSVNFAAGTNIKIYRSGK